MEDDGTSFCEPWSAHKALKRNQGRMYGYFRCSDCSQTWESSHVYCPNGSSQPQYGQECQECLKMCMPYRVEKLRCSQCGQHDCNCHRDKDRHIDPNKPHRADLCAKCKAGYPCA